MNRRESRGGEQKEKDGQEITEPHDARIQQQTEEDVGVEQGECEGEEEGEGGGKRGVVAGEKVRNPSAQNHHR